MPPPGMDQAFDHAMSETEHEHHHEAPQGPPPDGPAGPPDGAPQMDPGQICLLRMIHLRWRNKLTTLFVYSFLG